MIERLFLREEFLLHKDTLYYVEVGKKYIPAIVEQRFDHFGNLISNLVGFDYLNKLEYSFGPTDSVNKTDKWIQGAQVIEPSFFMTKPNNKKNYRSRLEKTLRGFGFVL